MRKLGFSLAAVLATGALLVSPAVGKRKGHATGPTCKQIKAAVDAGESPEDVAKDLKVSTARVKHCTAPAPAKRTMHRKSKSA
jgi:hypothetical protein